jgi:murein DD-endopeptidase MepM/ murein hydrolase activator NlpD
MKSISLFFYFLGVSFLISQSNSEIFNSPLSVLGTIKKKVVLKEEIKVFNINWVKDLKLILPCENIPVPKRIMRLPNAPRDYRNGTHRGIDFFANWGTPIRAVAEGVVIRSDLYYEEVPPDFRENVLNSSARVGKTPSDIFNSVLLGQAVFLDHGFDLIQGFRVISIYAHLSHINPDIKPGRLVKPGEIFAKSGNSGVKESTLGSRAGSHLHWELILQKGKEEIYLGRDIPNPELYNMLTSIFSNS